MRYRTIVADPPWPHDRTGITFNDRASGRFAETIVPYPTMSVGQISALPVKQLAQNDVAGNRPDKTVPRDGSILYLWTTSRYLPDAFGIVRAWGFTYAATLIWCKEPRGWGLGGQFQNNVEFVLVGRRGSPRPGLDSVQSRWFQWPRGEHSAKPEAFLDLVESVSPGPYLELFARRQRLGWHVWGNEVDSHVEVSS